MKNEQTAVRFSPVQRVEHFLVMLCFILLAVTGFPQKWFDGGVSRFLVGLFGGLDNMRIVHRASGILFSVMAVSQNTKAAGLVLLRKTTASLLPAKQDYKDAITQIRYDLGLAEAPPKFDRFDYRQKFEYWGLVLGGFVMIGTGFILLYPIALTRLLPGELVPISKVAHSNEGLMAFLVVITWHIFNAHLAPGIFPYDASIFTGKIPLHRMKHEHPLEYERLVKTEPAPEDPAKTPAPPLGSPSGAVGG